MSLLSLACATTPREAEPIELETEMVRPASRLLAVPRRDLEDVLSKGPGRFFERVSVVPAFVGGRKFIGYTLEAFYDGVTLAPNGIQLGDVVTAINGLPISRPDEFMRLWETAGSSDQLTVEVLRGSERLSFSYAIVGATAPQKSQE